MERTFTEQEIQEIYRAEPELRKLGLIVHEADADSAADITHNTNLILAWYSQNPGTTLTVQSLCQVAELLRGQLRWMSASQLRYNRSYESLSESKKGQFGQFWNMASTRRTLVQTGDKGFENCVALIEWARGRDFSIETFNTALSNLSAQGKLHLQPVRSPQRPGHTDDGMPFMPKEAAKPEYVGGKLNHARVQQQPAVQPERDAAPDAWKTLAENLRGATHSEDAALKSINGASWRETYTLRKKYLAQRQGSQFNRTAV